MNEEFERQALLDKVNENFGVRLLWHKQVSSAGYRDDVTTHSFFDPDDKLTEDLQREIRRWVESQGWQYSRQLVKHPTVAERRIEYIYLGPMILVPLAVGYHATRRVSIPSIMQSGMLPSTADRQTTSERSDCDGNIYVCERLGVPADGGVQGSESAHWWRAHLADRNRFNDPEWVILRIEIGKVADARIYRDIWSKSGIIVDNVTRIDPDLVRLVFPEI
jgi:hypothetical protein